MNALSKPRLYCTSFILVTYFLAYIVLFLVFSACRSAPKHDFPPIDLYTRDHFNFKPGTYWVYRDSLTGKEDSIAVTSNYDMVSTFDNTLCIVMTDFSSVDSVYWIWRFGRGGDMAYQQHTQYGSGLIEYGIDRIVADSIFSLNGMNFTNVRESHNIYPGYFDDYLYVNDDVLVIKARLNRPQDTVKNVVWELKRWKTVK